MRYLIAFLCVFPLLGADAGMDPDRLARIPARMQEFVDQGTAAGFVTLVARHGKVASLDAVGYRDLASKQPMRTDSIQQIMSCTKPITVAGLMLLVDEGRVSLTDPVEKYIPEFKNASVNPCGPGAAGFHCASRPPKRLVRLVDLATHTSGIAAGPPDAVSFYTSSLAEVVAAGAREPMMSDQGERWSYNNLGIAALGRVIEVVSGQSYEAFMQQRLFDPLGMKDTSFFPPKGKMDRVAAVYSLNDGKLAPFERTPPRSEWKNPLPQGGLYSTATDLLQFYRMMLDHGTYEGRRILSRAAVDTMTTVQTGDMPVGWGPGLGFGLGVAVVKDPVAALRYTSIGSYGHGGAYRTFTWADPDKDLIAILFYQRSNGGGDMADEINAFLQLAAAAIE
ncbi:MAG: serine hydrolase [Acidobacteria bacterium]|nr:serine hydrolase [Acidobacteriota bacterium]MDA1236360.1 serine hydrolase [Acidobacteriota bacterium]